VLLEAVDDLVGRRRPDGHDLLLDAQPAAAADDQVAGDDRRADAALDVALAEDVRLPVLGAGAWIEAGEAVLVVGEDDLGRAAAWLEEARRRIARAALPRRLPTHGPADPLQAGEKTRAVLIVGHDDQVVVHDGRGAEAVAGLERAQVGAPLLGAVVIQGDD